MTALFDVLSVVYAFLGLRSLWQLAHQWREMRSGDATASNLQLAWSLGFFVLTPLGVLIHEGAHLAVARGLGARETDLNFRLYWGYVNYWPRFDPQGEFAVAAAGPAASLLVGLIAVGLALWLPRLWSVGLQSFGIATLALVLIFYPAMSYWWGFGDFLTIYGTATHFSLLATAVHVAGLLGFAAAGGRLQRQQRTDHWASVVAAEPERRWQFGTADAERLRLLESSWTRVLPGVRQEMNELRELRDWIGEHNRQVETNLQVSDPAIVNDANGQAVSSTTPD